MCIAGLHFELEPSCLQRSIQRELFDSDGLVSTPGTSDSAKPVKEGLDTQESPQLIAAA